MSRYSIDECTNAVIHGDCMSVLPSLPKESYTCIFLDPPFNLQLKTSTLKRPDGSEAVSVSEEWDKFDSLVDYDRFTKSYLEEARRLLTKNGSLWIMGMYHNIFRIGYTLQDMGFWILNDVAWIKNNPTPNFQGTRLCNSIETLIWCVNSKDNKPVFNYQQMKEENGGKQLRSDWTFPICSGKERLRDGEGGKIHPTQKPLALVERVIKCCTNPGDLVLDFFAGSLTTGEAALNTDRQYTLVERNEEYIDSCIGRLSEGKKIKHVGGC